MAQSMNVVTLIGNVGMDPEIRNGQNGAVARLRIACNRTWMANGQKQERTDWVTVIAFGQSADYVGRYITKGMKLGVQGYIQTRQFEHQGQRREATEVVAREFIPMGGGQQASQGGGYGDTPRGGGYGGGGYDQSPGRQQGGDYGRGGGYGSQGSQGGGGFDAPPSGGGGFDAPPQNQQRGNRQPDLDDDIPF